MISIRKIVVSLVAIWFGAALSVNAWAATQIQVIDQHGQPLSKAVIELDSPTPAAPVGLLKVAVMDQVNKQFSPEVLVIQQGQSVLFPNSDDIRHHVYSFSAVKPFEIKLYSGNRNDPISFERHGVAVLGCNIHDSMVGYIYIAQSTATAITDENGMAELAQAVDENTTVNVWHSRHEKGAETRLTLAVMDMQKQAGKYVVKLNVTVPPKRNTFGDKFAQ